MSRGGSELMADYFKLAVHLFHEYKWVYDFKATDILSDDVMRSVPLEFQNFFKSLGDTDGQFHELLNLQDNEHWPVFVRKFVKDFKGLIALSKNLKCSTEYSQSALEHCTATEEFLKLKLPKKWNPKKYFEVVHVGNFVGQIGTQEECDLVVDIGSGLGYLSSHLACQFKVPVVGVESEAFRVQTANNNYATNRTESSVSQSYECLRITENISEEIKPFTSNYSTVGVTALHACGDLTPWSLKHFVNSGNCKMVAVVPCCYHKMSKTAGNFPMSGALKSALMEYEDISFLQNQWLWRLASQRAGGKFLNDIRKETQNLFYRALLERYILRENFILKRKKRNAYDSNYEGFAEYLDKTIGESGALFGLARDNEIVNEAYLKSIIFHLKVLHNELNSWSRIITGILALQGTVQIMAEELILLDRLGYMEESDLVKASGLVRVIPEHVSPRGMVLFGIKK